MKQHKYFFVLLFSFFAAGVYAQPRMQSSRDTLFKPTFHQESGFSVYLNGYAVLPVVTYWGRVNIREPKKNMSLSVSSPFSLGGFIGTYGGFFVLDAPITFDLNVGHNATSKSDIPVGGFFGVGGGFNMMLGNGFLRSYGPLVHFGVRAVSPFSGRSITLRFSYLIGLGGVDASGIDYNPSVFGIGAFYAM